MQAAAAKAGATAMLPKPYSVLELFHAITPHIKPDDPLLLAGRVNGGPSEPIAQEWKRPDALHWTSGPESALSRNRLLLPIVRATGKKIPVVGKIS